MAQQITQCHLRAKVDIVNGLLGYSVADGEGPQGFSREIGSIRLSGAYGGYAVHQLDDDSGGIRDLTGGHNPARECAEFLSGMIAALRIAKDS